MVDARVASPADFTFWSLQVLQAFLGRPDMLERVL
jgi:hypothetical protein